MSTCTKKATSTTSKKYVKRLFKVIDRFIVYFILIHAGTRDRTANESELNLVDLSCSLMQEKKYVQRVLLDLNLCAEY